jgi:hypothetical protein
MEVHAHTHTARKKWTHYFWEFLMLFLAVFCGFLAEYQLEHKIERDRAKELAKSLFEELKSDSIFIRVKYQNRVKQENALQYLRIYFRDSNITRLSKNFVINFHYGIAFRTPSIFEPRTVVLEQLKNSGSLRYFKSKELQKLIGDISVSINNINDRQALETSARAEYINPIIAKHNDYDFSEAVNQFGGNNVLDNMLEYEKRDTIIPFQLNNIEDFNPAVTSNVLGFFATSAMRGTRNIHFQKYIEVNAALLKELRKVYHIK